MNFIKKLDAVAEEREIRTVYDLEVTEQVAFFQAIISGYTTKEMLHGVYNGFQYDTSEDNLVPVLNKDGGRWSADIIERVYAEACRARDHVILAVQGKLNTLETKDEAQKEFYPVPNTQEELIDTMSAYWFEIARPIWEQFIPVIIAGSTDEGTLESMKKALGV